MDSVSAVVEENPAATGQMTAQVQEASAAAHNLNTVAQTLRERVQRFRLADDEW